MTNALAEAETFPPKLITGMHFPALTWASGKFMEIEAERRLWLAALAVELYRVKHAGELPASLDDLQIPEPADAMLKPFAGKTLLFEPRPDGYGIRSVDTDRLTAVGAPLSSGTNDFSINIVYHYGVTDAL